MTDTAYEYIVPTGVIVPDTSATQTEVEDEFKQAFGADLIVDPATPQGVLITGETLARNNFIKNNAALANMINPNLAGGVFFDAIFALTGGQRESQTATIVTGVTITGVPGTTIPIGAQAKTAAGDLFTITQSTVLPVGGSTTATFQSNSYGSIPCAIDALDQIVTAILGWETVNNSVAGVLGTTTQSDQAARALRQNTLAFNAISLAEAITSALYYTAGVTSLTFRENIAATTQTINGISMLPHSVYACVAGGEDVDVAAALLENKSSGAAWNGNTDVSVVEPASGQTYTVSFDRPEQVGILVKVYVSGATTAQVQQAILDYQAGTVADPAGNPANLIGFVVGGDVSPFELAAAVSIENPGAYVSNVEISLSSGSPSFSSSPIPIAIDQQAFTQISFITVILS